MHRILIATKNPGKLHEFKKFLAGLQIEVVSLFDLEISEDISEDGKSYLENATKKAKFFAELSGLPTIADDGGIEIDYLDGSPGIKSRRYFGKDGKEATDEEIISEMDKIAKEIPDEKRGAKFVAVIVLAMPNGNTFDVTGIIKGEISSESRKNAVKGYPYRSFFYLPKLKKFYRENELSEEESKLYNHRYKAVQKLLPIIRRELKI
ncbi:MAG: Non-canonical purine NTP pyrophosphatase [Candidatus Levybacteria bacterium]|nr:Non-canonical purine NTP pyrophosphatase [Candidatus Levybacteria bacterium]